MMNIVKYYSPYLPIIGVPLTLIVGIQNTIGVKNVFHYILTALLQGVYVGWIISSLIL